MSAFVNDRDVFLEAQGNLNLDPRSSRGLFLKVDPAFFHVNIDGVATPSVATFTAQALNLPSAAITWEITDGGQLDGSSPTMRTQAFGTMATVSVRVTVTIVYAGETYIDTATLGKLSDGTIGVNGLPGKRGNVNLSSATTSSTWHDSEAAAVIAAAGYGVPQIMDVVALFNSATKYIESKIYSGQEWMTLGQIVNGALLVEGTVFSKALATGAVTASKVAVGNADQVVPDSNMLDHVFWGRADDPFIPYPGTFWKSTRVLSLGIRGYEDIATPFFPIERGGIYKFDVQIFTSGDYQGQLTVVAHLPNQEWLYMGCPQLGYNNGASGLPVSFDGGNHQGGSSFTATRTINSDAAAGATQIRIVSNVVAGYVQIGGIRITRVMDRVLIGDGEVDATKIKVDQLDAINARIGTLRTATSGARSEIKDNLIAIYDGNNTRRIHLGDSSL